MIRSGPPESAMAPDGALAHAAAHLVRVLAHPDVRRGDPHRAQQRDDVILQRGAPLPAMVVGRLADLVGDRQQRVQRGHRVLQDHRDALAPHPLHLGGRQLEQVHAVEDDLAARDRGALRQQPEQREAGRRLAGAGLADQAEALATVDGEAGAVDGPEHPLTAERGVGHAEVSDVEQRLVHQRFRCFGSSLTRSQSPNRLAASTTTEMQMPGQHRQPPLAGHQRPSGLGEHVAPGRRRRLDAQAEEAQRRLGDDDHADRQAGEHHPGVQDVRHDVANDDLRAWLSPATWASRT